MTDPTWEPTEATVRALTERAEKAEAHVRRLVEALRYHRGGHRADCLCVDCFLTDDGEGFFWKRRGTL